MQVFHTLNLAYINAAGGVIDVTFVIDGTVDPTSCGGLTTDAGCLTLFIDALAPLTDSYGAILATGSAAPEFSQGGHPGWDASHSGGGGVGYDLTVSPIVTADPTDKSDCKKGGYEDFGFRNQGQCIRFVMTGKDSR